MGIVDFSPTIGKVFVGWIYEFPFRQTNCNCFGLLDVLTCRQTVGTSGSMSRLFSGCSGLFGGRLGEFVEESYDKIGGEPPSEVVNEAV